MANPNELLPSAAGWAVAGAIATKLVEWLLAMKNSESDRITKTYDAVNAAQKHLVDGLFQQIEQLRSELTELRAEYQHCAERHKEAESVIEVLQQEVRVLREKVGP